MRTTRLAAFAVALTLTAGYSGLAISPAFADDEPTTEQVAAPAPEEAPAPPAPEPAPAPEGPVSAPEPAPASDPAPAADPAPASDPAPEGPADGPATDGPSTEDPAPQGDGSSDPSSLTQPKTASSRTLTRVTAAGSNPNVTLCHATQGINPWISITVDEQGAYNGHVDPPSNKDDHTSDIIPPFTYKVKGVNVSYPGLNLNTLFGGIPGSVILANGCAAPTVVTPAASATPQTCSAGTTLVDGRIQLTMITGVTYTITGPGGTVNYNGSGLSDPVAPGVYSVAFTLAGTGYYTTVTSPISVTVSAYTGVCSGTPVTPAAVATPETCVSNALVDGSIQLTILTGVNYTITGPGGTVAFNAGTGLSDPVAPGTYSVAFTLDSGYTTAVTSPISVVVDPYSGVCGQVTQVTPAAVASPETCSRLGTLQDGSIQLTMITGVTYTITGPGGTVNYDGTGLSDPVGPGNYSVTWTLDPGLGSSITQPIVVVVDAYAGVCTPPSPVTPAATATPQTCVAFVFLTDGYIQLTVTSGVNYTITGPGGNVPFNLAGITGPVAPGDYSIGYTLDPGYTSAVPNPFIVTVDAYPAKCDLTTFPLVVPKVVTTPLGCSGDGSYTLSNDLSDPAALTWKANGSTVSESTHVVTGPTTIVVTATANGPSYGMAAGTKHSWTLKFSRPASCDLLTLAMTGGSPMLMSVLAGILVATGLGLMRLRSVTRPQAGRGDAKRA